MRLNRLGPLGGLFSRKGQIETRPPHLFLALAPPLLLGFIDFPFTGFVSSEWQKFPLCFHGNEKPRFLGVSRGGANPNS